MLSSDQIVELLDRLKWKPIFEKGNIVVAEKAGIGYSDDPKIGAIQAALSIMLEVASRRETAIKR